MSQEHEAKFIAVAVVAVIVAAIVLYVAVQANCDSKTCPPGTKPFLARDFTCFTCICAGQPK